MNNTEYQEDLKRRQEEHLRAVQDNKPLIPCMHDQCTHCLGTSIKLDGTYCFHAISCNCPKCNPICHG